MHKYGTSTAYIELWNFLKMEQNFLQMFLLHLVGFDVSLDLYFKSIGILFLFNNEN